MFRERMGEKIDVKVKTYANLRDILPSKFTISLDRSLIEDLLSKLYEKYPKAKERIEGSLSSYIILKNGRNIVHLKKKRTRLENGDIISIFPPIGGGTQNEIVEKMSRYSANTWRFGFTPLFKPCSSEYRIDLSIEMVRNFFFALNTGCLLNVFEKNPHTPPFFS